MHSEKLGSLTQRMAGSLRSRIAEGHFQRGEKLPTEKALALEFGVSRTVVREAVAGLRAGGLIEARRGVGVFVAGKDDRDDSGDPKNVNPLLVASTLDRLELRMAIEVHAAGLAATRRSWSQENKIWCCADEMRLAALDGKPTEHLDLAFHRSIAEATNNPAFVAFFDVLGQAAIPENSLVVRTESARITELYLKRCQSEHFVIHNAIVNHDVDAARAAMTAHLVVSQNRFGAADDV